MPSKKNDYKAKKKLKQQNVDNKNEKNLAFENFGTVDDLLKSFKIENNVESNRQEHNNLKLNVSEIKTTETRSKSKNVSENQNDAVKKHKRKEESTVDATDKSVSENKNSMKKQKTKEETVSDVTNRSASKSKNWTKKQKTKEETVSDVTNRSVSESKNWTKKQKTKEETVANVTNRSASENQVKGSVNNSNRMPKEKFNKSDNQKTKNRISTNKKKNIALNDKSSVKSDESVTSAVTPPVAKSTTSEATTTKSDSKKKSTSKKKEKAYLSGDSSKHTDTSKKASVPLNSKAGDKFSRKNKVVGNIDKVADDISDNESVNTEHDIELERNDQMDTLSQTSLPLQMFDNQSVYSVSNSNFDSNINVDIHDLKLSETPENLSPCNSVKNFKAKTNVNSKFNLSQADMYEPIQDIIDDMKIDEIEAFKTSLFTKNVQFSNCDTKVNGHWIASLYVRNFMGFIEETFKFQQINVIYGGNSSGKSTLVKLAAFVSRLNKERKLGQKNEFFTVSLGLCDHYFNDTKEPIIIRFTFHNDMVITILIEKTDKYDNGLQVKFSAFPFESDLLDIIEFDSGAVGSNVISKHESVSKSRGYRYIFEHLHKKPRFNYIEDGMKLIFPKLEMNNIRSPNSDYLRINIMNPELNNSMVEIFNEGNGLKKLLRLQLHLMGFHSYIAFLSGIEEAFEPRYYMILKDILEKMSKSEFHKQLIICTSNSTFANCFNHSAIIHLAKPFNKCQLLTSPSVYLPLVSANYNGDLLSHFANLRRNNLPVFFENEAEIRTFLAFARKQLPEDKYSNIIRCCELISVNTLFANASLTPKGLEGLGSFKTTLNPKQILTFIKDLSGISPKGSRIPFLVIGGHGHRHKDAMNKFGIDLHLLNQEYSHLNINHWIGLDRSCIRSYVLDEQIIIRHICKFGINKRKDTIIDEERVQEIYHSLWNSCLEDVKSRYCNQYVAYCMRNKEDITQTNTKIDEMFKDNLIEPSQQIFEKFWNLLVGKVFEEFSLVLDVVEIIDKTFEHEHFQSSLSNSIYSLDSFVSRNYF
eukprot:TRINITY_DN1533_c0_g1_i1.p1 TRINITY_DN1533_c0_g1~~TRINITY_DN1533_c0_g1_i1.p1  ORF type:complete len:1049 (+),score=253.85 TRINITY_DN1533_c0_g1_i1:36-3149(+)